jgi:hypothetical protein
MLIKQQINLIKFKITYGLNNNKIIHLKKDKQKKKKIKFIKNLKKKFSIKIKFKITYCLNINKNIHTNEIIHV